MWRSRPSERGAGHRGGAEPIAYRVERSVEAIRVVVIPGQFELRTVVVELADRNADERDAACFDRAAAHR